MTTIAYGLDFAGFSTGGSALARADRNSAGDLCVTVYMGHCFAEKVDGFDEVREVLRRERAVVATCLQHATLTVDIPIDLQGLPTVEPRQFSWELTLRPVDCAFNARPPLADRLGAPVARFAALASPPQLADNAVLGTSLFETYPAAALELMGLPREGYKGHARYQPPDGWIPVETKEEDMQQRAKNQVFARMLNLLAWNAPKSTILSHDSFDATLCAITGTAEPARRLEGVDLERAIQQRLTRKKRPVPSRMTPPTGYALLTVKPCGVGIRVHKVETEETLLSAIRTQAIE